MLVPASKSSEPNARRKEECGALGQNQRFLNYRLILTEFICRPINAAFLEKTNLFVSFMFGLVISLSHKILRIGGWMGHDGLFALPMEKRVERP